ncbi:hypothetical protein FPZ42_16260 [Mucilaginibacter achroorhodeus]|uniref:Uncharacterized protein n=1 Tax=Mucilaginibacter achroorhodeus TaxID=2599294 RepID=A0A563TZD0_9SPHI|nr:hypothetical protein [Mucilaginibacter achroorhodeus]TWR24643.1 hypothetical protein FPZ42_16260 [Mucilaginibacter achroorhodeus]
MNLLASLVYNYRPTTRVDDNGSRSDNAQVSIAVYDALTGKPTNGNYCVVTYTITNEANFVTTLTAIVPGLEYVIYDGAIAQVNYGGNGQIISTSSKRFDIVSVTPGNPPTPNDEPLPSSLLITDVKVDKVESAQGANDAQITVYATSNYLPIAYKLDGVITSASPVFTNLSGGSHTITAVDASGGIANYTIYIRTNVNLLVSDPSVNLPGGNISRWSAAFNPIIFTYQRRDFDVTALELNTADNNTRVITNTDVSSVTDGDLIYIKTPACEGTYKVLARFDNQTLVIDIPFTFGDNTAADRSGFININRLRPYYKMLTRISFFDKLTGKASTITSTNRPDNKGITRADISNFLQSLLKAADSSDYAAINFRDDNLSASYQIAYAQHWDDGTDNGHTTDFISIEKPYYVLYSARQLGDKYGGNMAAYVPFTNAPNGIEKARWITDFAEPAYSNGYPFDLSFIYSEDLVGRDIYAEIIPLDINRDPLPGATNNYLMNDDGGWLLNSDGSRYLIAKQTLVKVPVPGQLGLNRLLVPGPFASNAYYFNVTLKYDNNETARTITKTQTVRIDDAVDDQSIYLRWIGLTGGNHKTVSQI